MKILCYEAQKGANPRMRAERSGHRQQLTAGPWEGPFPFLGLSLPPKPGPDQVIQDHSFGCKSPKGNSSALHHRMLLDEASSPAKCL